MKLLLAGNQVQRRELMHIQAYTGGYSLLKVQLFEMHIHRTVKLCNVQTVSSLLFFIFRKTVFVYIEMNVAKIHSKVKVQ